MINAQASLALDTANLIDPDDEAFVVPKVELPEQEGLEHLKGPIEKVWVRRGTNEAIEAWCLRGMIKQLKCMMPELNLLCG